MIYNTCNETKQNNKGEKKMKRVEMYEIKRLGMTNTRGTRVRIKDVYCNKKNIVPYDYEIGDILEQGKRYIMEAGKTVIGYTEGKDCYYIIAYVL